MTLGFGRDKDSILLPSCSRVKMMFEVEDEMKRHDMRTQRSERLSR